MGKVESNAYLCYFDYPIIQSSIDAFIATAVANDMDLVDASLHAEHLRHPSGRPNCPGLSRTDSRPVFAKLCSFAESDFCCAEIQFPEVEEGTNSPACFVRPALCCKTKDLINIIYKLLSCI